MKSYNANKNPIQFNSKKQELEILHENYKREKLRFNNASDNSHKIIQYPNRRKKNVKKLNNVKENIKKSFKERKYMKIILCVVALIILLSFIDKIIFSSDIDLSNSSNTFTTENIYVPASKNLTHSLIIDKSLEEVSWINLQC